MKLLGLTLITFAIFVALFGFVIFADRSPQNLSPIVQDDDVRVIYLTPTK